MLWGMSALVIALPAGPRAGTTRPAFETVFNFLPRLLAASLIAFWAGEFANSYTMAKLKLLTQGRWLWTRTIGSTIVGQAVDTSTVILVLFIGTYSGHKLAGMIATAYIFKVAYEVLATPLTYLVIGWLKRAEGIDTFDRRTNFNPFRFADKSAA